MHLIFKSLERFDEYLPGFKDRYLEKFLWNYDDIKNIKDPIREIEKIKYLNVEFLFFSEKYSNLILKLRHAGYKVGLIGGIFTEKFASRYNIPYISSYPFKKLIIDFYFKDKALEKSETKLTICKLVNIIKNTSIKYLILPIDYLFLERFLIYIFKQAGKKTITIQDGFVSKKKNSIFPLWLSLKEKISDIYMVWGEYFFNIQKKYFKNTKILGYPHKLNFYLENKKTYNYKNRICLVGQDFENYDLHLGKIKQKLFSEISYILKKFNFNVFYKPHPSERNSFIPKKVKIFKGTLSDAFRFFDVFIGINSTLLMEASLNKKIAIQILLEKFPCDNFQQIGISYTYENKNLKFLPKFIKKIKKHLYISQKVVLRKECIHKRFIEILKN